MIRSLLNNLEDPEQPLLGPTVKALTFWGLLLPEKKWKRYLYTTVYISTIIFIFTEWIDCWLVRDDFDLVLENLKTSTFSTFSFFKAFLIYVWQNKWKKIIAYVNKADLEQRKTSNPANIIIIKKFTRYCRILTYAYWALIFLTGFVFIFQPLFKYLMSATYRYNVKNGIEPYTEVIRSWVPLDKTTITGYLIALLFQSYAMICGVVWVKSFDTNAIVVLVFFRVELEVLRNDSGDIFGSNDNRVNEKEAFRRLKNCHSRYTELVRHAELFNTCLSPPLFIYVLICSLTLCITAYQLTEETTAIEKLVLIEYLTIGVLQLFFYCWHVNEVTCASEELMLGPYESQWLDGNTSQLKATCILIHQFDRSITFNAGPFVKLNLATLTNILKGAYSYFTLMNQFNN